MGKLSLGKLNLLSEEVLERNQLSMIYGGSDGSFERMRCQCDPGVGTWYGTYCSGVDVVNDITNWCEGGTGSCRPG